MHRDAQLLDRSTSPNVQLRVTSPPAFCLHAHDGRTAAPSPPSDVHNVCSAIGPDGHKEKLLVSLRDGRKFIGVLRTWDQYANLVLQNTVERIIVDDMYCDIKRGVFIVRGENVLLLGEIDLDKEDFFPYRLAPHKEVFARQLEVQQEKKRKEKTHKKKLLQLGFETETEVTGL